MAATVRGGAQPPPPSFAALPDPKRSPSQSGAVNVKFAETQTGPPKRTRKKSSSLDDDEPGVGWLGVLPFLVVGACVFFQMNFHVVKGGRFGATRTLIPKEAWSLRDTLVDLDDLNPKTGYLYRFRQGHEQLYHAVRNRLLEMGYAEGKEGTPTSDPTEQNVQVCYANQQIIEGARRHYFYLRGVDRNDIGSREFWKDMKAAGLLEGPLSDPGEDKKSLHHYSYDSGIGQVSCAIHGAHGRRMGGAYWDRMDFKLIFTQEPLSIAGGTDTLDLYLSPGLANSKRAKLCLHRLATLSYSLYLFTERFLAGQKQQELGQRMLKQMMERGFLVEIPLCPSGDGKFNFEVAGYRGSYPKIRCGIHKQSYP